MVTVFLRGGLGNQMFQYALGLHLAKKNNTTLVFDTVYLRDRFPRKNFAYRTYDLDVFAITPRFTALSRVANAAPIPGIWLGADLLGATVREFAGMQKMVREKSDFFDPAVLEERGNLLLFGRWQSEKYFEEIAEEVRITFQFRESLTGEAKELGKRIRSANSVSLHVRRGDFAAFKNVAQLMGKTNLPYYQRAATYIGERVKNPEFFIFSDDIAWCKENLKLSYPATYMPPSATGSKAAFDLELMSLCKHNIIANSTFSWWGAWLNRNPEKIIVTPRIWYADGRGSEPDLLPERWIKI